MNGITIAHTADWEVDTAGKLKQGLDRIEWAERLLEEVASDDADIVVVAGDMFNSTIDAFREDRFQRVRDLFVRFRTRSAAPIFIIDSTTHRGGPYLHWLESIGDVRVCQSDKPAVHRPSYVETAHGEVGVIPITLCDRGRYDADKMDKRHRKNSAAIKETYWLVENERRKHPKAKFVATMHSAETDFSDWGWVKALVEPNRFHYVALGDKNSAKGEIYAAKKDKESFTNWVAERDAGLAVFSGSTRHSDADFRGQPRYVRATIADDGVHAVLRPWGDVVHART
jgi:hypothetical protein